VKVALNSTTLQTVINVKPRGLNLLHAGEKYLTEGSNLKTAVTDAIDGISAVRALLPQCTTISNHVQYHRTR